MDTKSELRDVPSRGSPQEGTPLFYFNKMVYFWIETLVYFSIEINREMFIMDYLGSPRYSKELFEQVIIQARKLKVNFVATMDNPYFRTNSLWRKGFVNYYDKNFTALPLSLGIESKATNINSWELVAGMHDSI